MRTSFLQGDTPILTAMIPDAASESAALDAIAYGLANGAEAFGLQMETMPIEARGEATLRRLFSAMQGRPAYVTNYRYGKNGNKRSDEVLAEELLCAVRAGAVLVDMRGDMFCPTEYEMTEDPSAIEKQRGFSAEVHAMGGEVLVSSHISAQRGFEYRTPEEVLALAQKQIAHGGDLSKIVTAANSDAELAENFRAIFLLKEKLGHPFLFLCNGSHAYSHRLFGPTLGGMMFLAVSAPFVRPGIKQPPLARARALLDAGHPNYAIRV